MSDDIELLEGGDRAILNELFKFSAIVLAIGAFCSQPVLPFVDPNIFTSAGIVFAAGLGSFYYYLAQRRADRVTVLCGVVTVIGFAMLIYAVSGALENSVRNDARCLALEVDMLSGKSRFENAPDVFQALKCRPQTGEEPRARAASTLRPTG